MRLHRTRRRSAAAALLAALLGAWPAAGQAPAPRSGQAPAAATDGLLGPVRGLT